MSCCLEFLAYTKLVLTVANCSQKRTELSLSVQALHFGEALGLIAHLISYRESNTMYKE